VNALVGMMGVAGVVILVAALLSGLLDRSRLPQILVFLILGTALGPLGLGAVDLPLGSPAMGIIGTIGLVLVLFTDAVNTGFTEVRRHARLVLVLLGPGTFFTAAAIALAGHYLLGVSWGAAALLGAALASTDPVLLRGVLRDPNQPEDARHALRLEAGMNDVVLLPIVLLATALLAPMEGVVATAWTHAVLQIFLVGTIGGVVVGLFGVGALDLIRRRVGIRRDYESIYAIGVAFVAFALAETLGGSGFIGAFAAGLTIATLDVELCDCFFDYGETTAELALIFTFVALGTSAIWLGLDVIRPSTLAFAAVALFVRSLILWPALAPLRMDRRSRLTVIWFGPRGLSTLLLFMVPVFAGVPGAHELFAIAALVVLLSIAIHGGSLALIRPPSAPKSAGAADLRPRSSGPGPQAEPQRPGRQVGEPTEMISIGELTELRASGAPVTLLDVRGEKDYAASNETIAGAHRILPASAVQSVRVLGLPPDTWLVSFCT
jgi:sodium/hydrogen antiporter